MRVVLICETFSKKMGYLNNTLPKYLARLGVDVHVLTTNLPPYYQLQEFDQTFGGFNSFGALNDGAVESFDGYTIHVLAHRRVLGYVRMVGLPAKLKELRPDVVQTYAAIGWLALDAAICKLRYGYKLFTGNHNAASTFPLARRRAPWWDREMLRCLVTRFLPGRMVSLVTEKCYAVAKDRAYIASQLFGVQRRKVEIQQLGTDVERFEPASGPALEAERLTLREQLGFGEGEVVCIYTGQLTEKKNAIILARAVERLRSHGHTYSSLFIGGGCQFEKIAACDGATCLPFLPYVELPPYYRAADISVWPVDESISTFDAAASGLPLVVSDFVGDFSHVNGNGLVYKLNDIESLMDALLTLRDSQVRRRMGALGAEKMRRDFNIEAVAASRLRDYARALRA
jgi:glycosyltransferase involved in cell wall biosynthesis